MSYTITITGHGATGDEIRAATQTAIDTLAATGDVSATFSGSDRNGGTIPATRLQPTAPEAEASSDVDHEDDSTL